MTVGIEKLVRMAEQIAANVSVSKDPDVVADAVVSHLQRFWDPRMRANFIEHADVNTLSPILQRVVPKMQAAGEQSGA